MSEAHPVRASWGVLWRHRGLTAFPLLGGALTAAIGVAAAAPALLYGVAGAAGGVALAALVLGYLALGFVLTACSAALTRAAAAALDGRPVPFGANLAVVLGSWRKLLGWSLLSSTVLVAVRQLDRLPGVGELLDTVLGVSWSVATYLVLPGLVLDDLPIREAARRSARTVRSTFSRQIYGSLWIAAPLALALLLGLVAVMLGIESNRPGPAIAAGAFAALLLGAALLVGATLSGIFRTLLYRAAR
ncbi:DUF6159 family protein [Streptomyces sp. TLI_171]|uniref:DUF6159 family protein n=1 Tax=Streptomyces sp. TLI_171 TaxID=1938859 RepID=UPI000C177CD8|nr:DUF6159 family protein [Streptomyces sp. TLI_171]RKE17688.1 hypothetical protein BX266_0952 [Streptomyces sp. TLI_171]